MVVYRHYDEWDYRVSFHTVQWATVYEPTPIRRCWRVDRLIAKHDVLAKRLKKNMIEIVKPQNKKRIRFRKRVTNLDVALRSIVDYSMAST